MVFKLCLPCCTKTTASHKSHQQVACIRRSSCVAVPPKQLLREPQDKREGTSTIRRVWHVCGGPLICFTLPSAIDFQSRWVLDITRSTPFVLVPTPNFCRDKNLLAEKYLSSKYFSSSRFSGNIPRVKFGSEIFQGCVL